jgi:hypothetical protein
MSIVTSGTVSFSDLRLVFKGVTSGSISMSELYSDGANANGISGIPISGSLIGVSHFYGKSKNITITPRLFTYENGEIQYYTAPATGTYKFILIGAGGSTALSGGSNNNIQTGSTGGYGGFAILYIPLTAGEVITLGIGGSASFATSTPANSSGYSLRGGSAGTGQGAGGGGTYIYTSSPGSRANWNGYLGGVGGGGGGAFHGFPGNIGGAGIGAADAASGNGYGYDNLQGPTSPTGTGIGGSA